MKTLFYNANILTPFECYKQMLIEDDKILYVGNFYKEEEGIKKIDLENKTIVPGFIDTHGHFYQYASLLNACLLSGCKSENEILLRLINYEKENHPTILVGYGYDNNELEDRAHPTLKVLDKYFPFTPVILSHISGHMGVINSAMLKKIKYTKKTKINGGILGTDENGELNGYLEENAFMRISRFVERKSPRQTQKMLENAQDIYLSNGIILAQEGLMRDEEYNGLKMFNQSNKQIIRIVGYADIINSKEIIKEMSCNNDLFYIKGAKIILDGSPQGKTAALNIPYENDTSSGYLIHSDEVLKEVIEYCSKNHLQLLCHANGDRAIDQFLRLSKESAERNVIIHAQLANAEQIDKMKEFKIIPSFFASHIYYFGDTHLRNLGNRAQKISLINTAIKNGIHPTIHNDMPVCEPLILQMLDIVIKRRTKNNIVLSQDERLDLNNALALVTKNAAYQYHLENTLGQLAEGYEASFVILSNKLSTTNLLTTKVERVYIKGVEIYHRKK